MTPPLRVNVDVICDVDDLSEIWRLLPEGESDRLSGISEAGRLIFGVRRCFRGSRCPHRSEVQVRHEPVVVSTMSGLRRFRLTVRNRPSNPDQ